MMTPNPALGGADPGIGPWAQLDSGPMIGSVVKDAGGFSLID